MPSLFVIRGGDQGVRFELERPVVSLGRDASNTFQLHDTEVSRRHIEIRQQNGVSLLVDLHSSNGTFVNGTRVNQHELVSGDEIEIGRSLLLFTGAEEASDENLAEKIDIITRQQPGDRSRIVHAISQAEGSRILDGNEDGVQSPWLARARSNLQVMYRTALAVSHTLDIDQLLHRIMQLIFEWVEADRGCIMLLNESGKELEPKVRRTRKGIKTDERISISKTILDYVLEHNEGVLTSAAEDDERWNPAQSIVQLGIREAICVPMRGRYDVVGVIYIDTSTSPQRVLEQGSAAKFTEEHLKLMVAIGHQAALAIEDTRYYSAMVQAERLAAVGQTIAVLSHHIKNILQGIRGGSFLIKEGLAQHDETMLRRGWEFVEKNQDRISNLVMDMLTFSKQREPDLVLSNLNQVVSDVVELMLVRAKEKSVELVWEPGERIPQLTFDPEGMHRAVLNVLTNAIDACDPNQETPPTEPGRVRVTTSFDAEALQLRCTIEDNGPGIPEGEVEHIFSLFVSNKGNRGTGLGLPVSQKIVREHGGQIIVSSEPGRGSRFTLEIPAVYSESMKQTSA